MGSHAYNQDPEPPVRWLAVLEILAVLALLAVGIWLMGRSDVERKTGSATTNKPNSPAITGDGNTITIDWGRR